MDQRERIYDPDKDFSDNSAMKLTFKLETWFKVTAHPLPNGTLLVKNESDWAKERDRPWTRDLGWTDGRKTQNEFQFKFP